MVAQREMLGNLFAQFLGAARPHEYRHLKDPHNVSLEEQMRAILSEMVFDHQSMLI